MRTQNINHRSTIIKYERKRKRPSEDSRSCNFQRQKLGDVLCFCFGRDFYYGFGLSVDTRDSNAYVSRAKRVRVAMRKLPRFQAQLFRT